MSKSAMRNQSNRICWAGASCVSELIVARDRTTSTRAASSAPRMVGLATVRKPNRHAKRRPQHASTPNPSRRVTAARPFPPQPSKSGIRVCGNPWFSSIPGMTPGWEPGSPGKRIRCFVNPRRSAAGPEPPKPLKTQRIQ